MCVYLSVRECAFIYVNVNVNDCSECMWKIMCICDHCLSVCGYEQLYLLSFELGVLSFEGCVLAQSSLG